MTLLEIYELFCICIICITVIALLTLTISCVIYAIKHKNHIDLEDEYLTEEYREGSVSDAST